MKQDSEKLTLSKNSLPKMFDNSGTCIPSSTSCYFTYPSSGFYKLNPQKLDVNIAALSSSFKVNSDTLSSTLDELVRNIKGDSQLSGLLNGPYSPFVLPKTSNVDVGQRLESELLPELSSVFTSKFPQSHFKAIAQDKLALSGRLKARERTNYDKLINQNLSEDIAGFVFPLAFNQYSLSTQVEIYSSIEDNLSSCLSGPLELSSMLIGAPDLLIHSESYSPILIAGGVTHFDSRLVSCFKSYGKHLEFWVLSNLLTKGVEQVSEQWSGCLTIFTSLN